MLVFCSVRSFVRPTIVTKQMKEPFFPIAYSYPQNKQKSSIIQIDDSKNKPNDDDDNNNNNNNNTHQNALPNSL